MKVTTGLVRLSYAHLTAPVDNPMSGKTQYTAALIIPKDNAKSVAQVENAVKKMMEDPDAVAKWGGSTKGVRTPIHDGDVERPEDPNYANSLYINVKANADYPPKLYDKNRMEIVDPEEIYSGCYGQAILSLYAYNFQGSKGLAFGINAFRKIKDGPSLAGVAVSDKDFDDDLLDLDAEDLL